MEKVNNRRLERQEERWCVKWSSRWNDAMDLNLPICGCVFLFSFFFWACSGKVSDFQLFSSWRLSYNHSNSVLFASLSLLWVPKKSNYREKTILESGKKIQKTVKGKAGEEHIAQRRPKPSTKFSARDCNVFRLKLVPQTILNRLIQEHVSYRTVTFEDSIKIYKAWWMLTNFLFR